ncbi:putative inorganic carbon transporter subunit DabA, partial [Enterococcus faecium]|uniref:putative inorganic carbon transporter subunit DabA n=1 Tax=Enterococcus faecium TaxID=1352 RepID=UPI003F436D7F
GAPAWSAPVRRDGMWASWRRLAALDPTLPRQVRAGIRSSAHDPADAIDAALERWGVDDGGAEHFLRAHVLAQPGWAAVLRTAGEGVDLTSFL